MHYGVGHFCFSVRGGSCAAADIWAFVMRRIAMKALIFIALLALVYLAIGVLMFIVPMTKFIFDLILWVFVIVFSIVGIIILK